jgi:glycosyltransferase involved in cell wall biosynthesis
VKILLWTTLYFPNIGGLEKMAHSLAVALQEREHEVVVVCNGEKKETFTIDSIPVFTFPFISALFSYRLPLIREILDSISELFSAFSFDVVNIHGWFECFCFYQNRVLAKQTIPVCLTIHGFLEQEHYQTENCQKIWHRAEAVNTVSEALLLPQPHPFTQTIYNGLPLSKVPLQPLAQNRLLLVGRLTEEKCYNIAFEALRLLLPQYPDLQMTLLGDGPDYEKLWNYKQSHNLPIEMPGFVSPSQVENYIDQSTMLLVPSSYESFSLAALEGALRGRPVVASRVLGLKEVIEEQKTGLLVEPHQPEALKNAIASLLSNPAKREEMGKAAFERARRLFTIDVAVTHYLRMYEQASHLCHHPRS